MNSQAVVVYLCDMSRTKEINKHAQELGRLGGLANVKKHGKKHMAAISRMRVRGDKKNT